MPPDLPAIQRWIQSVITHPDGVTGGIDSDEARREIDVASQDVEQVVSRSQALTSIERLEIYGNAYFARLLECLRETFPAMVHATGQEVFDQFAFGYLQQYPSTSYTLGHLADNFMTYLSQTRPDMDQHHQGVIDWPDFLIELATLEWTIEQVFDGPGVEDQSLLDAETLLAIPAPQWPNAQLVPVVCLQLLKFHYPVNDYFTAVRKASDDEKDNAELPAPRPQYVALTRRDYIVHRYELEPTEFELLSRLVAGESVGAAIMQVAAESDEEVDALARHLQRWFTAWTSHGFFESVEAD
ncbi:MAG: DNA-binding domain-containing protein [Planctomycetota bacterium]|nr:DNA-binding domain-containing protein [Planctomycetota bacterium]